MASGCSTTSEVAVCVPSSVLAPSSKARSP